MKRQCKNPLCKEPLPDGSHGLREHCDDQCRDEYATLVKTQKLWVLYGREAVADAIAEVEKG
jgi:hypothetical protein